VFVESPSTITESLPDGFDSFSIVISTQTKKEKQR